MHRKKERKEEERKKKKLHIRLSEDMSVHHDLSFFTRFVQRDSKDFAYQARVSMHVFCCTQPLQHDAEEN